MASTGTAAAFEEDESHQEKMWDKIKKNPMVPLGIAGMLGMVAAGGYNYKNRGNMSTSIYLMHLRVRAQGMVVGAITLGIGYTLLRDYVFHKEEHERELEKKYGTHKK